MGLIKRAKDYLGLQPSPANEGYETQHEGYAAAYAAEHGSSRYSTEMYSEAAEPERYYTDYSHSVEIPVSRRESYSHSRPSTSYSNRVASIAEPVETVVESVRLRSYAEVTHIGAAIRDGSSIVFSLEEMKHEEARRVIDFVAGVCWAFDYNFRKVQKLIFSASPRAVSLRSDEIQEAIVAM